MYLVYWSLCKAHHILCLIYITKRVTGRANSRRAGCTGVSETAQLTSPMDANLCPRLKLAHKGWWRIRTVTKDVLSEEHVQKLGLNESKACGEEPRKFNMVEMSTTVLVLTGEAGEGGRGQNKLVFWGLWRNLTFFPRAVENQGRALSRERAQSDFEHITFIHCHSGDCGRNNHHG